MKGCDIVSEKGSPIERVLGSISSCVSVNDEARDTKDVGTLCRRQVFDIGIMKTTPFLYFHKSRKDLYANNMSLGSFSRNDISFFFLQHEL